MASAGGLQQGPLPQSQQHKQGSPVLRQGPNKEGAAACSMISCTWSPKECPAAQDTHC